MLGYYFYNKNTSTNTIGTDTSFYQKFNPFGGGKKVNNGGEPTDTSTVNVNETGGQVNNKTSRFTKITNFVISGATFFEDTRLLPKTEVTTPEAPVVTTKIVKGKVVKITQPAVPVEQNSEIVPSIRYVERATGHVYQMYLDTKITGKISNSTIPSVYETIFDGKANSLIYRYISPEDKNVITSFLATLGGKSGFLSENILQISLSPDKSKFFSIIKNANGVLGIIKSFDETKTNQVFNSAFTEWLPQWVTEQNIYLTTKPSYLVEGSVFSLNTTNGTLSKIFGGIKGLTTLANNDGTSILYGASLDNGPKLNVFNVKNHTSLELDKYGLPEKCIWSSDNINVYCAVPATIVGTQYPDSWYQGTVSFNDMFIKINTQTSDTTTIANTNDGGQIDAINLFLNKDENKIFFTNKKDYTLWSLDM